MITLQQYISTWVHLLITWALGLWAKWFGQVLTFEESGISVRVGRPLAEGGFSVVLHAADLRNRGQAYALKRIRCHDAESVQTCQDEADVHQALQHAKPHNAKYLMPLYGLAWSDQNQFCYMLFPLFPHSLRGEVNSRIFFKDHPEKKLDARMPPWTESVVLKMFRHILDGVATMHEAGYTHRDIKLENILCKGGNLQHLTSPVLMDFGSAGPLTRVLATRQDILELTETASQHTTISYRPPELFAGELRAGDAELDYTKVDVWSCGCVLFAILYGASPFEVEFNRRTGKVQIVECTQLRVLGEVPKPDRGTPSAQWYSPEIVNLVDWILTKDRVKRPSIAQVRARVEFIMNPHSVDCEENLFAMPNSPFARK
eukprot:Nitzschia sp. Nitz4//scaffold195_size40117//6643//7761//NITZ4_007573-RA/size40117-processed-gene-0.13-mRNA-1//1//CDS//3329540356//972//frame0